VNPELSDLLIFLSIVCVPILAVGVAFNLRGPLGRALAARIQGGPDPEGLAALEQRLDARLASLERAVGAVTVEVERVGERQRALLARRAEAPVNTPGSHPALPHPRRHPTPH
jgi:hypothetical protein